MPMPLCTVRGQSGDLGIAPDLLRRRATLFFVWMALFIAAVALIGFIPAIAVFVFAYMAFGFGEPRLPFAGLCRRHHAAVLGGVPLGATRRLAAIAARRSVSRVARLYRADLIFRHGAARCSAGHDIARMTEIP